MADANGAGVATSRCWWACMDGEKTVFQITRLKVEMCVCVEMCVAPFSNSRPIQDRFETFHRAAEVPVRSQSERFAVSGRRDPHQ